MFSETLRAFDLKPTDVWMILIGMALFWGYYKLSSAVLFSPLLRLFERRESATVGAQAGADEMLAEAAKMREVYEETIAQARQKAVAERLEQLSFASKDASDVVAGAEAVAKEKTLAERASLSKQEEELRAKLLADSDTLAEQLASRILEGGSSAQRV
ncbi:hypothetical protein MRY87_11565 [bacterium]|nr:hypothetical protein [bacterium]